MTNPGLFPHKGEKGAQRRRRLWQEGRLGESPNNEDEMHDG